MSHRKELDALLETYENYVGSGSMKQAGRLLPKIINKLLVLVEDKIGNTQMTDLQKDYQNYLKESKKPSAPPPCEPCDVSLENNEKLIEDFKVISDLPPEDAERQVFYIDVGNLSPEEATDMVKQAINDQEAHRDLSTKMAGALNDLSEVMQNTPELKKAIAPKITKPKTSAKPKAKPKKKTAPAPKTRKTQSPKTPKIT